MGSPSRFSWGLNAERKGSQEAIPPNPMLSPFKYRVFWDDFNGPMHEVSDTAAALAWGYYVGGTAADNATVFLGDNTVYSAYPSCLISSTGGTSGDDNVIRPRGGSTGAEGVNFGLFNVTNKEWMLATRF